MGGFNLAHSGFSRNFLDVLGVKSDYLLCIQSIREDKTQNYESKLKKPLGIYGLFTKNNARDGKPRGTLKKDMMTKYEN